MMSNERKRWAIGENDIDRDNELISRDPLNSSYIPTGSRKTDFSKRNVITKISSIIIAALAFILFNYLSKNVFLVYSKDPVYLIITLILTISVYFLSNFLISRKVGSSLINDNFTEVISRKFEWKSLEYYKERKSSFKEKIEKLIETYGDWEIINPSSIEDVIVPIEVDNIFHNTDQKYSFNEICDNITLYKMIKNEKNELFYSESASGFHSIFIDGKHEELLLIFIFDKDDYTYLFSNSGRFHCQLVVDKGITEEDKQIKSNAYHDYLSCLHMLSNYYK